MNRLVRDRRRRHASSPRTHKNKLLIFALVNLSIFHSSGLTLPVWSIHICVNNKSVFFSENNHQCLHLGNLIFFALECFFHSYLCSTLCMKYISAVCGGHGVWMCLPLVVTRVSPYMLVIRSVGSFRNMLDFSETHNIKCNTHTNEQITYQTHKQITYQIK